MTELAPQVDIGNVDTATLDQAYDVMLVESLAASSEIFDVFHNAGVLIPMARTVVRNGEQGHLAYYNLQPEYWQNEKE